jgi:hypothetical protein
MFAPHPMPLPFRAKVDMGELVALIVNMILLDTFLLHTTEATIQNIMDITTIGMPFQMKVRENILSVGINPFIYK